MNLRFSAAAVFAILPVAACSTNLPRASSGASGGRVAPALTVTLQTTVGDIVLELDPAGAPISTGNFLNHALKGHYDGTIFHRTVPGFVIQGGGFNPDLTDRGRIAKEAGRPDDTIVNEWSASSGGNLKNLRGTVAWARDAQPDTATREFYINTADNAKLDTPREATGRVGYAVFGRVVKGMDVVDAIERGATIERLDLMPEDGGMKNVPVTPVVIRAVRVKR